VEQASFACKRLALCCSVIRAEWILACGVVPDIGGQGLKIMRQHCLSSLCE